MKESFAAEEATELELKFNDGTSLNLIFNVRALSFVNDKVIGGLEGMLRQTSVPEYCAKVVYITAKAAGEEMTIQKARTLVCQMHPKIVTKIVQEYQSTFGGELDEEAQKKAIEEIVKAISK